MNVFVELEGYSPDRAFEKTRKVYHNVKKVIEIAKRDNISTHIAADRLAEERIKTIGQLKQKHPGKSSRSFTTLKEVYNLNIFLQVINSTELKIGSANSNARILIDMKKYEQALDLLWMAYEEIKHSKQLYTAVGILINWLPLHPN
jgi:hypothetical protein